MDKIKNDPAFRLALAMLFFAVQFSWAYGCYSEAFYRGGIVTLEQSSPDLAGHFFQALIVAVPMIALFLLSILKKGRTFPDCFLLGKPVRKNKKVIAVLFLTAILLLAAGLILKQEKMTVLYQWVYYFFLIAFFEEFMFRGMLPEILGEKLEDEWIWLTPNILFGLMHGVLPLVNGTLKLIPFLRTDFIYFTAFGLLMEWLKRKTGSLWVPILVHGIFDFMFVLL